MPTWLAEGKAAELEAGDPPRLPTRPPPALEPLRAATRSPRSGRGTSPSYIAESSERFAPKTVDLRVNVLHDMFKTAVADELVESTRSAGWSVRGCRGAGGGSSSRGRFRVSPRRSPTPCPAGVPDVVLTGLRRLELQALRWRTSTSSRACSASSSRSRRRASGRSRSQKPSPGADRALPAVVLPRRRRLRVRPPPAGLAARRGLVPRRVQVGAREAGVDGQDPPSTTCATPR